MTKMKTTKCGWCGQQVQVLANQRIKPHRNGAQNCPGSGQPKPVHDNLTSIKTNKD